MGPPGAADTASRRKTAGGATVSLLPGLCKRKPGLRGNPAGRGLGGKPPSPRPFPASRKTWNRRAGNPPSAVAWGRTSFSAGIGTKTATLKGGAAGRVFSARPGCSSKEANAPARSSFDNPGKQLLDGNHRTRESSRQISPSPFSVRIHRTCAAESGKAPGIRGLPLSIVRAWRNLSPRRTRGGDLHSLYARGGIGHLRHLHDAEGIHHTRGGIFLLH